MPARNVTGSGSLICGYDLISTNWLIGTPDTDDTGATYAGTRATAAKRPLRRGKDRGGGKEKKKKKKKKRDVKGNEDGRSRSALTYARAARAFPRGESAPPLELVPTCTRALDRGFFQPLTALPIAPFPFSLISSPTDVAFRP